MSSCLVTGWDGFVGRALCARLLRSDWRIRGTARTAGFEERRPEAFETVNADLIGPEQPWRQALSGIDLVIHLAARVHVMKDSAADPLAAFRLTNVVGTERLARLAASRGAKRFVYLSSVKVNGEGAERPYSEADAPAPEDPYAVSKFEAEQSLRAVARETGLELVILRPPLIYGPGVKANFLRLLRLIDKGVPLPLASVRNRRSLIYLGNLIDAVVQCAMHPKAAGKTYLVSDGEDVSTPELIARVGAALGSPARLVPFPPFAFHLAARLLGRPGAARRLFGSLAVDSSQIRKELGWASPCTMAQGLSQTAKWYNDAKNKLF